MSESQPLLASDVNTSDSDNSIGKPGYGKSILPINIIEHLRFEIARIPSSTEKGIVAYFHFEKMQLKLRKSNAALRSVLSQLLQTRQTDTDFVDVASILYDNGVG